jgi:hypothetical protein
MGSLEFIQSSGGSYVAKVDGYTLEYDQMRSNVTWWRCQYPNGSAMSGFSENEERAKGEAIKAMNDHKAM